MTPVGVFASTSAAELPTTSLEPRLVTKPQVAMEWARETNEVGPKTHDTKSLECRIDSSLGYMLEQKIFSEPPVRLSKVTRVTNLRSDFHFCAPNSTDISKA